MKRRQVLASDVVSKFWITTEQIFGSMRLPEPFETLMCLSHMKIHLCDFLVAKSAYGDLWNKQFTLGPAEGQRLKGICAVAGDRPQYKWDCRSRHAHAICMWPKWSLMSQNFGVCQECRHILQDYSDPISNNFVLEKKTQKNTPLAKKWYSSKVEFFDQGLNFKACWFFVGNLGCTITETSFAARRLGARGSVKRQAPQGPFFRVPQRVQQCLLNANIPRGVSRPTTPALPPNRPALCSHQSPGSLEAFCRSISPPSAEDSQVTVRINLDQVDSWINTSPCRVHVVLSPSCPQGLVRCH